MDGNPRLYADEADPGLCYSYVIKYRRKNLPAQIVPRHATAAMVHFLFSWKFMGLRGSPCSNSTLAKGTRELIA